MGIAASQARFLGLTARKVNVEFKGQQINQARTALADQSANLFQDLLKLRPATPPNSVLYPMGSDDPQYKIAYDQYLASERNYDLETAKINAETEEIQQQDRALELQLKQLDTEQQALSTEMESVKKVIDKNIDLVFKTFA